MKEQTKIKRQLLGKLTAAAREMRDAEINRLSEEGKPNEALRAACRSLNSYIIENFYQDAENVIFNTFNQWQQQGYQVKKGSKAFVLWGRPLASQKAERQEEPKEGDEQFFPLCHLFSNAQVIEREKEEAEQEPEPEEEETEIFQEVEL